MVAIAVAIIVFAYVSGSVPFGLVISKFLYKADIREFGSGNIGATNMFRTFGPIAGGAALLCDFMKAFIPVIIAKYALAGEPGLMPWISVGAGIAAMIGHSYSMFLKFSGGKGMSAGAGMVAGLWPLAMPILVGTWVVLILITRYVSLASIVIVILLPITVTLMYRETAYIVFSILATVVVIYRHRSNISRLLNGTELKIGKKATLEEE